MSIQPPAWLDRREYPFALRRFALPMGQMNYVDEGEGEAIVMVHGNPAWSFLYRRFIKRFKDSYRCIAMDHIGFGLSDKPFDWSYRPQEHAENLWTLLDAIDVADVTLVVQDWGGPIGLSYAIRRPDRVKRLVILNTWMWPVNDDWYYIAFSSLVGGVVGRLLIRHLNFFASVVMKVVYGDKAKLTPHIHAHYLNALATPKSRKGSWVFPQQIIGATDWLAALWAQRDRLAAKPAMIAWGMKDLAFREQELNRWISVFPNAPVTRYHDAGHYVQDEKGTELADVVAQFVRST
jgi:haloalkane dehalogenase